MIISKKEFARIHTSSLFNIEFLNTFYTKMRLFQGLLPIMELLKKMFPTMLNMKNELKKRFPK